MIVFDRKKGFPIQGIVYSDLCERSNQTADESDFDRIYGHWKIDHWEIVCPQPRI